MTDVTAETAKKTDQKAHNGRKPDGEDTALQHCYGEIGIPAVAAAARYQGAAKNMAYAPAAKAWQNGG